MGVFDEPGGVGGIDVGGLDGDDFRGVVGVDFLEE